MEASSSRHGGASGESRNMRTKLSSTAPIHSLGPDLLCSIFAPLDHFDLVRCSSVCKPWKNVIYTSALMRDLYYKRNPRAGSSAPSGTSMRAYLEDLAMEQHRSALSSGSSVVHQWSAHSARVNLCRMKRGLIVTGAGDKVLRLWSAESYKCLDEFSWSNKSELVDCDFDENKIVGLSGSQICIWRYNGQRSVFQSREGIFTRGLCMRYIDPEAAIGCEDGRACIFDLYSGSCSRIIRRQPRASHFKSKKRCMEVVGCLVRSSGTTTCQTPGGPRMHGGPVTSLALTDENMIFGGSTFGTIAIADLSTGERLAVLKSAFAPTGMKSLCFNSHSSLLFAGSTSGYAHCWDLRTLRPLWEMRVSPNVIYATHHLSIDSSTLALGGLDGVLRILSQSTGELLSSFVMDPNNAANHNSGRIQKKKVRALSEDVCIDQIDRCDRPPITSLSVGMKKIVTTHNEKYVRMWKFNE